MDHADHVALLRAGVPSATGPTTWADLGAGTGAFTLALAELLGPGSTIHPLDRDASAVEEATRRVRRQFARVTVLPVIADLRDPLPFGRGSLDGVVMTNSLHVIRDPGPVLASAIGAIRPGGRFLLVEYGTDAGNDWVPWPLAFATWRRIAGAAGLVGTRQIGEVPSRFLGSIYAAASEVPG